MRRDIYICVETRHVLDNCSTSMYVFSTDVATTSRVIFFLTAWSFTSCVLATALSRGFAGPSPLPTPQSPRLSLFLLPPLVSRSLSGCMHSCQYFLPLLFCAAIMSSPCPIVNTSFDTLFWNLWCSMAAYNKIRNGARPSMEKLKTRYPGWIINLLSKCFLHNPVDRPTAVEIVDFVRVNQAQKSLGIGGSVLAVLARLPRSIRCVCLLVCILGHVCWAVCAVCELCAFPCEPPQSTASSQTLSGTRIHNCLVGYWDAILPTPSSLHPPSPASSYAVCEN